MLSQILFYSRTSFYFSLELRNLPGFKANGTVEIESNYVSVIFKTKNSKIDFLYQFHCKCPSFLKLILGHNVTKSHISKIKPLFILIDHRGELTKPPPLSRKLYIDRDQNFLVMAVRPLLSRFLVASRKILKQL